MTKPIATALVATYFGVEDSGAPGTAVPADKQFATLNVKASGTGTFTEYESEGTRIPVAARLGQHWGMGDLDGPADYREGPYLLNNAFKRVTRTAVGSSSCFTGLWAPDPSAAETQDTWTLERGDGRPGMNTRFSYAQIIDLGINATRKAVKRKGKLLMRKGERGVDLTGGATRMAQAPIMAQTVDLFLADSWAGLDSADVLDDGWEIDIQALAGSLAPTWPLNSALPSFKDLIAATFKPKVKILVAVNSTSLDLFTTMEAGDLKWVRLRMIGDQAGLDGSTPVYFTEQWDLALQVSKVPDEKDHEKAYSFDVEFIPVPDPANSSHWLEVTSITDQDEPLP